LGLPCRKVFKFVKGGSDKFGDSDGLYSRRHNRNRVGKRGKEKCARISDIAHNWREDRVLWS